MTSLARIFQAMKRGRLSYVNISSMRLDGILLMLGMANDFIETWLSDNVTKWNDIKEGKVSVFVCSTMPSIVLYRVYSKRDDIYVNGGIKGRGQL